MLKFHFFNLHAEDSVEFFMCYILARHPFRLRAPVSSCLILSSYANRIQAKVKGWALPKSPPTTSVVYVTMYILCMVQQETLHSISNTLSNVAVALKTYLVLMAKTTVVSDYFLKFKLVKNCIALVSSILRSLFWSLNWWLGQF